MTDRSTYDSFEQRLASEFERYVAVAVDPRPSAEVAAVAMQSRGLVARARNASRRRRFLLLGLAAVFLVPAAYLGAGSIRPAPDFADRVQPLRTVDPPATSGPNASSPSAVAIFVRRDDTQEPGISIFAVRPDGAETRVRHVPDSVVPGGGKLSEWGTVGESGWLALASDQRPWPMVLIDLGDGNATPWVVTEASTGGISPRWGPTGLAAAEARGVGKGAGMVPTGPSGGVVIADPRTHSTRIVSMPGGLVGGGPSIIWTADGSGILGSTASGALQIVPINGGDPRPGVGEVFDPTGIYGTGLAHLRICVTGMNCPGGDDGRIERVELDGSLRTIWRQQGGDRPLAADFGNRPNEYWLSLDHDSGRQVAIVHVHDGRNDGVATINRNFDWQDVAAPVADRNQSMLVVWIYVGVKPVAAVVPLSGAAPTIHTGQFSGFVEGAASVGFATVASWTPIPAMTAIAESYRMPPLDDLIAAEHQLNPGRLVLGKAWRDAVDGEVSTRPFEVPQDQPGAGELRIECFGPSSATVTSGPSSVTDPCLRSGGNSVPIDANTPVIVTASGDTSWRAVIYSP